MSTAPDPHARTGVAAILKLPETVRRFAAESAEVEIRAPAEIRKMIHGFKHGGRLDNSYNGVYILLIRSPL